MQQLTAVPPENEGLLLTREVEHTPYIGERRSGLSPDFLIQSASRLRVLALLYALVFFMVALFPELLVPQGWARMFGSFIHWGPPRDFDCHCAVRCCDDSKPSDTARDEAAHRTGVRDCRQYGIAGAEFLDPSSLAERPPGWTGLSWVAVWTVLFTIVVPTKPSRALAAAVGSVSAVPVVVGSAMATGAVSITLRPIEFLLGLVFPYLFVIRQHGSWRCARVIGTASRFTLESAIDEKDPRSGHAGAYAGRPRTS
jgi:hypothetical protein